MGDAEWRLPTDSDVFATAEELEAAEFDSCEPTYAEALADLTSLASRRAREHAKRMTRTLTGTITGVREAEHTISAAQRAGLNRRRIARLPTRSARRLVAARAHRRPTLIHHGGRHRRAPGARQRSRRTGPSSRTSSADPPGEGDDGESDHVAIAAGAAG
jgi:hypothetical protein